MNVGVHWKGADPSASRGSPGLTAARAGDRPRGHEGTSDTELAIFEATEQLLAEGSLNDLSVAQIISAAGISRATFYFYFSSKFAVLGGLLARVSDEIFQVVQPFVQREESVHPEQALRDSLAEAVALWQRHRPALRAIHEHWNATDQLRVLWISVIERFTDAVATELDRQKQEGQARHLIDSRTIAATLLWSTIQCLYVAGMGVDSSIPDETAALPALITVWRSALYGI
ncbi:MAG TPA: TetR/AcrR family transcriptional regulator [Solirubrobacteraceae bacterium]|nr:TetR/AcrR family transcriptional regulator [Solirubrobacteraceae bacterium]